MKKYLNKGLLYEWFNSSKAAILIGIIVWGFYAFNILCNQIDAMKLQIEGMKSNYFETFDLILYFILGIIFLAIYITGSGINKRNKFMFLYSGPFTKKQIKFNELICLLITLGLFIIMYIYIAIIIYIRNSELMSIINDYPQIISIEIIKVFLFGTIGILLMVIFYTLFSNTIIAFFGIIALCLSTIAILANSQISLFIIYDKISFHYRYSVNNAIKNIFYTLFGGYKHENILFSRGRFYSDELGRIFTGSIFLLMIIIIMLLIFNTLQKRENIETSTKIFSCKSNENIIIIYLSLGIASFINFIILGLNVIPKIINYSVSGFILYAIIIFDIIIFIVISFISYKIFKKILKIIA